MHIKNIFVNSSACGKYFANSDNYHSLQILFFEIEAKRLKKYSLYPKLK